MPVEVAPKSGIKASIADAKEFSMQPNGQSIDNITCGGPTCQPGPCRGCKPTCAPQCRVSPEISSAQINLKK